MRCLMLMILAMVLMCGCGWSDPADTATCPLCGEDAEIRSINTYSTMYRCDQDHYHFRHRGTGKVSSAE